MRVLNGLPPFVNRVVKPFAGPLCLEQEMMDEERARVTEQSNVLRAELKLWEKKFAAANNGQKASREDIKKNPEIGTHAS